MKKKYYVVWKGVKPGIYDNWEDCKKQVNGFSNPKYKSFSTLEEAQSAYAATADEYLSARKSPMQPIMKSLYGEPIVPSIAVDGAYSSATKMAEYQCVDVATKRLIFKNGPFLDGTNNVMEFLALVHALAMCKKYNLQCPIYSDSVNAMKWVRAKKANTKMQRTINNGKLFELMEKAEIWLQTNTYSNQILKWHTDVWGEIPADFGRK